MLITLSQISQHGPQTITHPLWSSQKPLGRSRLLLLFPLLLVLLQEDNLSNCMFHHSNFCHSRRLLVSGTAKIHSPFEEILECFTAGRKQPAVLLRLQHQTIMLSSWLQLMLATAAALLCQQSLLLETRLILAKVL